MRSPLSARPLLTTTFTLIGALALCGCPGAAPPAAPGPSASGGLGPDEIPLHVTQRCPGDPACPDQGDGKLYVGVAAHDITPLVEPFTDLNHNGVWDPGEPFTDRNGNGVFDAYWIAGYGTGRLAYDVHDPVWARALALRRNHTTVVLVAVDSLGLFYDETAEVQRLLAGDHLDITLLMIAATHCHQTADLVGAWGKDSFTWGVNESYQAQARQGMAQAVRDAVAALRPASRVTFSAVPVEDGPTHDMHRYVSDTRDPVVIDNVLRTIQFSATAPDGAVTPVATLVNWAHHPESAGADNHLISSDWVHFLREKLEQRGAGTVVYVSGALGGQIGPGRVQPVDSDGNVITQKGFPMAEAIGKSVADFALEALADPKATTVDGAQADLSYRTTAFKATVSNTVFQYASLLKVYRRSFCCYDKTLPLGMDNPPWIETQATYLRLGPAAILTNPGELLPELFIGGYDGKDAGTYPFIDKTKPNAPDVSKAPAPPYLIDIMDGPRAYRQTWGLTHDFVGYIIPRYNFVLADKGPYLDQAPGDHYEETNSLGPLAEPQIAGTLRQLVLDGRPNQAR